MATRCSRQELILAAFAFLMGLLLRASHTDQLAVEHFDEGVYSSSTWYDAIFGDEYPMRHLYAPPLLPGAIAAFDKLTSGTALAPFLPSIILGAGTVGVIWWMSRQMFGQGAALFSVFVAAFSDFHTLYSRMALTDAPVLFFICLSIGLGTCAIQERSSKRMALAGLICGLGWWTKYSGWLPIAVLISGSAFWWLLRGRQTMKAGVLIRLCLVFSATAFLAWCPWLWLLQEHGGYAAVQENHRRFWIGWTGWQSRLGNHITYYFSLEGWFGAAAIGLGTLAAGTRRWIQLRRSTWNDAESGAQHASFPSPAALRRFVVGAVALFVVGTAIRPFSLLLCLTIGGLAGRFLWPVSTEIYNRARTRDGSPSVPDGAGFTTADFDSASTTDPTLGTCIVLAWFCGTLLMTPMYTPFPRLSLPLLASIWLASGAGVGWWIEGIINVERRGEQPVKSKPAQRLKRVTSLLVGIALGLVWLQGWQLMASRIWLNRTSLRDAAVVLGETVLNDAAGEFEPESFALDPDENGIITPWPESDGNGTSHEIPDEWSKVVAPQSPDQQLGQLDSPKAIVYVIGEPSLLWHLNSIGILAAPVQDFTIEPFRLNDSTIPTYLVLGPNALTQADIFYDWPNKIAAFDRVTDIHFQLSDIVLYNLFSPGWIAKQPEARVQALEVYRLKSSVEPR